MTETIIIGRSRLKKEGHYTQQRYLALVTKAFCTHDTVILQVNPRVEEVALNLINILGEAFKIDREKEFKTIRKKKGDSIKVIQFVLSKRHSIRIET